MLRGVRYKQRLNEAATSFEVVWIYCEEEVEEQIIEVDVFMPGRIWGVPIVCLSIFSTEDFTVNLEIKL